MPDNEISVVVTGEISRYTAELHKAVDEAKDAAAKITAQFMGASSRMASGHKTATGSMREETGRLLRDFEGAGEKIKGAFERGNRELDLVTSHVLGIRTALADLVAGFLVERLIKGFIDSGIEMEKFETQLKGMLGGSRALAQQTLEDLRKLSDVVPFSLGEVVDAYKLVREQGIEPTDKLLRGLADTAFTTGKSLSEIVVGAISQMPRVLRQMGVEVQKIGELAVISGRGVEGMTVRNVPEVVSAALLNVLAQKNAGAIAGGEGQTGMALDRIKKLYLNFMEDVGKEVNERLAPRLNKFIAMWKGLGDSGVLTKFKDSAVALTDSLLEAFQHGTEAIIKWVASLDTQKIVEGFKKVIGVIEDTAKGIAGLGIGGFFRDMLATYAKLDPVIQAGGLVYLALFGTTKALVIATAIEGIKKALDSLGLSPGKDVLNLISAILYGAAVGAVGGPTGAVIGAVTAGTAMRTYQMFKGPEKAVVEKATENLSIPPDQTPEKMSKWFQGVDDWTGKFPAPPKSTIQRIADWFHEMDDWANSLLGLGKMKRGSDSTGEQSRFGMFEWPYERDANGNFVKKKVGGRVTQYSESINQSAGKYGFDPALIQALMAVESEGVSTARSPAGAVGLMQLMPEIYNSKSLGGPIDPLNPQQNIDRGVALLAELRDKFHGDLTLALQAYNLGETKLREVLAGRMQMPKESREFPGKVADRYGPMASAPKPSQGTQDFSFITQTKGLFTDRYERMIKRQDDLEGSTGPFTLKEEETAYSDPNRHPFRVQIDTRSD